MSLLAIVRRLAWAEFPDGEQPPSKDKMATWPRQAQLICAGAWEPLRIYQAELLDARGDSPVRASIPLPGPRQRPRVEDYFLGLFVVLLLLSLLFAALSEKFGWCRGPEPGCEVVAATTEPPGPTLLKLSTDTLFDYNRDQPFSDEHRRRLAGTLGMLISQFGGITVESISAHTDPIGGTKQNGDLAVARARYVERMFADLAASPEYKDYFKSGAPRPTILSSTGPGAEDAEIWRQCLRLFQDPTVPEPLVELSSSLNFDHRPRCSQAGGPTDGANGVYAACAKPDRAFRAVAAERFRELTGCLAPMRHVVVKITHERQVVTPSTTCRVVLKKDIKG